MFYSSLDVSVAYFLFLFPECLSMLKVSFGVIWRSHSYVWPRCTSAYYHVVQGSAFLFFFAVAMFLPHVAFVFILFCAEASADYTWCCVTFSVGSLRHLTASYPTELAMDISKHCEQFFFCSHSKVLRTALRHSESIPASRFAAARFWSICKAVSDFFEYMTTEHIRCAYLWQSLSV